MSTTRIKKKKPQDRIIDGLRTLWDFRSIERQAKDDGQRVQKETIDLALENGWTRENSKTLPLGTFETDDLIVTGHLMMNTSDVLDHEKFIEWLKNKKVYYGAIHHEGEARLQVMEERYRKSIEKILASKS